MYKIHGTDLFSAAMYRK